jgi:hypothetical protein
LANLFPSPLQMVKSITKGLPYYDWICLFVPVRRFSNHIYCMVTVQYRTIRYCWKKIRTYKCSLAVFCLLQGKKRSRG